MKKIKLMLLSLSILAIVGAALAFAAKTSVQVCTALPVDGVCPPNLYCPDLQRLRPGGLNDFICTAATVFGGIDPCHYTNGETVQCGGKSVQSTVE